MSAIDALKRRPNRHRFRTVRQEEARPGSGPGEPSAPRVTTLRCSYRPPDADFYCWKYGVWYNLGDCCYRHALRTFTGCATCGQGRNNLKVHKERFLSVPTRLARSLVR